MSDDPECVFPDLPPDLAREAVFQWRRKIEEAGSVENVIAGMPTIVTGH